MMWLQEPEAARSHNQRLAKLCAQQGCLAAAEDFYFAAGEGSKSVAMWAGAHMWEKAHAATVRAGMSPDALQVN